MTLYFIRLYLTQARAAATAHKCSREELPHIRGQGQRPRVPGCDGAGMAERSYPASEIRGGSLEEVPCSRGRGGSWEETPHIRGQGRQSGGDTPGPRSGAVAERSYPTSEVSGCLEETPRVRGQGWREGLPCVRGQRQQ